eukprot:gene6972-7714_t
MNNIRNVESINEQELKNGILGGITKGSWHEKYQESAWVYLGGFSYELTEGDLICVMSQWGEIEDIHLVREKETGKSKGFAFVKYEDHRSTILAVDNFNGMKLLGRMLRCDHVENYKLPKHIREQEEEMLKSNPQAELRLGPGHAYKNQELASHHDIVKGVNLWDNSKEKEEDIDEEDSGRSSRSGKKKEKKKKEKKSKKHKKRRREEEEEEDSDLKEGRGKGRDREERAREERRSESRSPSRRLHHEEYKRDDRVMAVQSLSVDDQRGSSSRRNPPNPSSSFPPFTEGAVASWRGNRDPSVAPQQKVSIATGKVLHSKEEIGGLTEKRRDELSGIAGLNRVR